MFYRVLVSVLIAGLASPAFAEDDTSVTGSPDAIWFDVPPSEEKFLTSQLAGVELWSRLKAGHVVALDVGGLESILEKAPDESAAKLWEGEVLWLPMPDGNYESFSVVESPILSPDTSAENPEIRTYSAQGIDDASAVCRFSLTPSGFSGIILSSRGTVLIDPWLEQGLYASYYTKDARDGREAFLCGVTDVDDAKAISGDDAKFRSGTKLKTFRLAVACTSSYANLVSNLPSPRSPADAIAASVNRVNAIFERDAAIRFLPIVSSSIIFSDSQTDPFASLSTDTEMINKAQEVISEKIGVDNFDIGHVLHSSGGGLAVLGAACNATTKAKGKSVWKDGSYDVDFVCHEIGHQLGATHTFNTALSPCVENLFRGTAYEPGSGTTIMSYGNGVCGTDDLSGNKVDSFHSASILQMLDYVKQSGTCAIESDTGNRPPILNKPSNWDIPAKTPFSLTAVAAGQVGEVLKYSWEELDLGPAQSLSDADNGKSPLFRVWPSSESSTRDFPRLLDLWSGTLSPGEKLPTLSREMKFSIIVRDNRDNGGGVTTGLSKVNVVGSAGPFEVKYPNTSLTLGGGSNVVVKWDVAKTDTAPIDTQSVNIVLLTKDGLNIVPTLLQGNTPNDGKQKVQLSNIETTSARIKVEAVGNIFWDISDADFTISAAFPTLNVSPTSVSLDKDNTQRTVVVSPAEANPVLPLRWKATSSDARISVSPKKLDGKANTSVTIKTSSTDLDFDAIVIFANLDNPSDTQSVNVEVVSPRPPHIKLDKTQVGLSSTNPHTTVVVSPQESDPAAPLRWKAVSSDARIAISPMNSNGLSGNNTRVSISALDTSQPFESEITFTNLDLPNDKRSVIVRVACFELDVGVVYKWTDNSQFSIYIRGTENGPIVDYELRPDASGPCARFEYWGEVTNWSVDGATLHIEYFSGYDLQSWDCPQSPNVGEGRCTASDVHSIEISIPCGSPNVLRGTLCGSFFQQCNGDVFVDQDGCFDFVAQRLDTE